MRPAHDRRRRRGGALSPSFSLASGVDVQIDGHGRSARHFAAEYGAVPAVGARPVFHLIVGVRPRVGHRRQPTGMWATINGGHRVARWRARVTAEPRLRWMRCELQVAGPLGLTLAQSMVVEPLLSLVTPAAGRVLLPAALIEAGDGMVLVLGRSGSGKSTLAIRALAAGRLVGADDQVLLAADGRCAGLPRRLRVYGDLPGVVPEAHAVLDRGIRRRIALAAAIDRASRGRVSPPALVRPGAVSAAASRPVHDIQPARVVLLGASGGAPPTGEELVGCAVGLLAEQRARLLAAGVRPPEETARRETEILTSALAGMRVTRLDARASSDALRALDGLQRA